ncbi:HLA class II histocompatibility antigen, DO alpha chain isoform X2 [Rhinolophus sinicus]|uniref:HLA class II histocompatibility antigen, DO alpha chain isoform X2 n=1 Tax=Rhinolophus sinicus TaxID=89399 RepID=UPI003D7BC05D
MVLSEGLVLGLHTLMTLLSPQEAGAIKADHMGSYGPAFYQSYDASGQFTYEFDGEQLFSVELKKREAAWRLPEFGDFTHFDPQGGLASIAVIKAHLDVLVERSNRTRAVNMINITWLRNGQTVTEGVAQTSFYSQPDHLFRKFHYLTFVPSAEDVYDCRVEHWGLDEPLLRHWEPQVPTLLPDTTETLVCAAGLAIGVVGSLVGVILIITGTCRSSTPRY